MHLAAEQGNAEIVELLLQQDVNVNATASGYAALHLAAENGHIEVVRLLLEYKADPNLITLQGETAGYIAAKNNHAKIIEVLHAAWCCQLLDKLMVTESGLAERKVKLKIEEESQYNKDYKEFKDELYFFLEEKHGRNNGKIKKLIDYSQEIDRQIVDKIHYTPNFFSSVTGVDLGVDKREKQNAVNQVLLHLCGTEEINISQLDLSDEEKNALRDGQLNELIKDLDGYDTAVPIRETACIAM